MSMVQEAYSLELPRAAVAGGRSEGWRGSRTLGNVLVVLICLLDLSDWFIVNSDTTGTDTVVDINRLIPHLVRILFVLVTTTFLVAHWRRFYKYKLFWAQAAWLCIIVFRYLFIGSFDAQALLHCAVFASTPLTLWTFYILARLKKLDLQFLTRAGAVMVILYGLRILLFHAGFFVGIANSIDGQGEVGSIRVSGYVLLLFLFWVLLGRYKLSKLWFVLVAMLVAVLCMERSVQLEVLVGLPVLLLSYLKTQPRRRRLMLGVAMVALLVFAAVYAANATAINERWSEASEGGDQSGSGRVAFWGILLANWWNGDTFTHLLGFGQNSVYLTTKSEWFAGLVHAHNEWIQMLYEIGLIGLLSYALVIVFFWKTTLQLLKVRAPGATAILLATTVITVRSIFDFFLNSSTASFYGVTLGVAMGYVVSMYQVSPVMLEAGERVSAIDPSLD